MRIFKGVSGRRYTSKQFNRLNYRQKRFSAQRRKSSQRNCSDFEIDALYMYVYIYYVSIHLYIHVQSCQVMKRVAMVISVNQSCFGSHLAFGLFAIWIIHIYLRPSTVNKIKQNKKQSTKQVCKKMQQQAKGNFAQKSMATIFEVTFAASSGNGVARRKHAKSVCSY